MELRISLGIRVFLVVCLLLLIGLFWCRSWITWARFEYDQKISNFCVRKSVGEDLKWELRAEEAFVQNSGEKALLQQIKLHYFLKSGKNMVMSGDSAEVEFLKNQILMQGGIHAESEEGVLIEAETLMWDGSGRLITTPEKVTVRRHNIELCGQGLEADLDLGKIKIKSNAKTVIY